MFSSMNNSIFRLTKDYLKNKNRGLGLVGVRGVTEGQGGYLELSHIDSVFTLKAVLVAQ